jgi:ribosomal-protein-alanine N-acetyltransferase
MNPTDIAAVLIAPLRRIDVPRCAELERQLFPADDPWSEESFYGELDADTFYVGAYLDAENYELIGYAGLGLTNFEASVHTIGLDRNYQGKGIGSRLLRTLLTKADERCLPIFLEVRVDNDAALKLYQAHGFERIGIRRRYYQPSGADAYTMKRPTRHV